MPLKQFEEPQTAQLFTFDHFPMTIEVYGLSEPVGSQSTCPAIQAVALVTVRPPFIVSTHLDLAKL